MRVTLQRVQQASVTIAGKQHAAINHGMLILLGITHTDTYQDVEWLVNKITGLRIFNDDLGKINLNITQANASLLVVSQFTLYASTKRGNRPSFIHAASPDIAIPLYQDFINTLSRKLNTTVQSGQFGADMQVSLINDGPVTINMDSQLRE